MFYRRLCLSVYPYVREHPHLRKGLALQFSASNVVLRNKTCSGVTSSLTGTNTAVDMVKKLNNFTYDPGPDMKGKSLGMWNWEQKQSSEDGKLGYVQWK